MSILVLGKRERELDTLLSLSSWCHMQFVIVIFPNHTQLLFLGVIHANSDGFGKSAHLLSLVLAIVCLFVFVALRPMSTAMVIAGRSVHLTTLFPGQA